MSQECKAFVSLLIFCVVMIASLFMIYYLANVNIGSKTDMLEGERSEVIRLHNQSRNHAGLQPVYSDDELNQSAQSWAEHMHSVDILYHSDYHTENILVGTTTPGQSVSVWMNSPGHRENILNPSHNLIGVGRSGNYWCVQFGNRAIGETR